MSALAPPLPGTSRFAIAAPAWPSAMRAAEPGFFALGALLLALMLPLSFAALVDARLFNGVNVWDKPLKFAFALAVYVLTLAFFARYLPREILTRRWYGLYRGAVIAAVVAEMAWIGGAAALAIPSHFNATPLGVVVYQFMGLAAVLLTSASAVYAVAIGRNRATGLPPVLKEAVVLGLALVLPLTLITAGTMSGMSGHLVGGSGSDAGGLTFLGWAREGGDLRVAHFFATHAMHIVPLLGMGSLLAFGPARKLPLRLGAGAFTCLVGFTFVQALQGRPFLPFLG